MPEKNIFFNKYMKNKNYSKLKEKNSLNRADSSVLISLISDMYSIRGQYIKRIFGTSRFADTNYHL